MDVGGGGGGGGGGEEALRAGIPNIHNNQRKSSKGSTGKVIGNHCRSA